eukprot:2528804-Ditylum_brightwellii.AAC.1
MCMLLQGPKSNAQRHSGHLAKYLSATKNKGLILDPKAEQSFEVHADADFVGNWYKPTVADDTSATKSCS